jgi:glycosyltransferase involved in cell wall biosynthesis
VVASDVAGNRDPIDLTGGGVLVPPHDPAAMAGAITELLADPERAARIGEEAAAIVAADHSWTAVVDRLRPLLGIRDARARRSDAARP